MKKKDIPNCKWEIMICVFNIYMKERIEKPKLFNFFIEKSLD
jgi:hypothetical protein